MCSLAGLGLLALGGYNQGSPCDDDNACTENDTCSGGACDGTPVDADDGNECTDDSCDPATGAVHTPNADPCDDGDACTEGDLCSGGVCTGDPVVCPQGLACDSETGDCIECGPCPTDVDGDGQTDTADLAELLSGWGAVPSGHCLDTDQDGDLDAADLAELLSAWGACD